MKVFFMNQLSKSLIILRLVFSQAQELKHCNNVNVLALYTDALGELGGNADSCIKM